METNNAASYNEETKKDEHFTPSELMKKHMKDPNHVVTEEEFKKLVVGEEAISKDELIKEEDEKKDELDNLPDNDDIPNPFSVLGS